jgi:hypothetical protein
MSYRSFSLTCRCGRAPSRIEEIGVTDEHALVIHWWCDGCQKLVYAVKSLADCWRSCPSTEADRHFDARFLESLGIRP